MEEVKNEINALMGKTVKISISKGRGKSEKYNATVMYAYPNVFVLKIIDNELIKQMSLTYKDVICGDVSIK